jgi:hypothetical protein
VGALPGERAAGLRAAGAGGIELSLHERVQRRGVASAAAGSGAGEAALGLPAVADRAGSDGRARESQARLSRVPGGGVDDSAPDAETFAAGGSAATRINRGESGMGAGLRARRGGEREEIPCAQRGRSVYERVFGAGRWTRAWGAVA